MALLMTGYEAAIVAVARACVGARFRLHGRSMATGLDCVGVAALAYGREHVPAGYALRCGAISYYDPARDYQLGSQSARRDASARRAGTIELAAAVDAATAKSVAEARLAREWAGRITATLSLPWRRLDLGAGALLSLLGQDGIWRVTKRSFEAMLATLTAQRLPGDAPAVPAASAGGGVTQPDLPAGPTTLALLDLPGFGDDLPVTRPC